jgi:transposase
VAQKLILPLTAKELLELENVARTHHFPDYRFKARGIIAINAELRVETIAEVLGVSKKTVYNWAQWWREDGFDGLLDGHKGGRPVKLTEELIACAVEIATNEALTLAGIKLRMLELHPQTPDFSLDRLAFRLKEHRLSFKRCRLSLKKSDPNKIS